MLYQNFRRHAAKTPVDISEEISGRILEKNLKELLNLEGISAVIHAEISDIMPGGIFQEIPIEISERIHWAFFVEILENTRRNS